MKRLNIIGCGHVGQTLGYLWQRSGSLQIGNVLNSSPASAQQAVQFMGAGQAVDHITAMKNADFYLIGCPDNHIQACAEQLAASGLVQAGQTVFHCSGAMSSALLDSVRQQGAQVASLHPVKSFADPARAIQSFAGTWCGLEGDAPALGLLEPLVQAIGGQAFNIHSEHKILYHAASVMACNYLVALEEMSMQTFAVAGVERELAQQILQPIVQDTVNNLFALDTAQALTGPIARGDHQVVGKQLRAMQDWRANYADTYRLLGEQALQLARQRGKASSADLEQIAELFQQAAYKA